MAFLIKGLNTVTLTSKNAMRWLCVPSSNVSPPTLLCTRETHHKPMTRKWWIKIVKRCYAREDQYCYASQWKKQVKKCYAPEDQHCYPPKKNRPQNLEKIVERTWEKTMEKNHRKTYRASRRVHIGLWLMVEVRAALWNKICPIILHIYIVKKNPFYP